MLGCEAHEILFLDDSQLNVAAAKRVGINAVQAKGIAEAERILLDGGVIES
jgi:FMN phosphatase YigB (HAD superfamily)